MDINKHQDNQKLKLDLNLVLSSTIKFLQHECVKNPNDCSVLTTSNDAVQQLVTILEAGFLHGLKNTYFEKSKTKTELPKPQFWSLICKISHKSTLNQINDLPYIRTHVGRCRAWLRLALNENAFISYITSLLNSSDDSFLVSKFYEPFSLFLDEEQRDIFLSYLNGIENLHFDIACNSSLLNSWTKTPLELSGIIAPSTARILSTLGSHSGSLRDLRSPNMSDQFLSNSTSNLNLLAVEGEQRYLSSFSTPTNSPQLSPSTSKLQIFSSLKDENLVEDSIDARDDKVDHKNDVLHERLQLKSKRKSFRTDDPCVDKSRSNSPCPIKSQQSDDVSDFIDQVASKLADHEDHSAAVQHSDDVIESHDNEKEISDNESSSSPKQASTIDEEDSSMPPQILISAANDDVLNTDHVSLDENSFLEAQEDCSASVEPDAGNMDEVPAIQFDAIRRLSDASLSDDTEESFDVYAVPSSSHSPTSFNNEEFQPTSYSSSGRGNSLSCGAGWSTELDCGVDSKPAVVDNSSLNDNSYESSQSDNAELKIREGFLQKKGETFGFWREKWFVLTTEKLACYKDASCEDRRAVIELVEIKDIEVRDQTKKKQVCLMLFNNEEYCLSAEDNQDLSGWINDFYQALKSIHIPFIDGDLEESSYVVLDETGIDPSLNNDNTSWNASMRSHIFNIATEKGLDTQKYQCFDCAAPIGMLYGAPRVCHFTGHYYCPQCHLNDEHQIPARMLHNWDFRKHKVSKRSNEFLNEIWNEPCIDIDRFNPIAYQHLDELSRLLPLRCKLVALHPYVNTCRFSLPKDLFAILKRHYYMIENPHLYSPYDLAKARGNSLLDLLNKALSLGTRHVKKCELCSSKGFLCEVCRKDEIIFAFQTDTTNQCSNCNTVYHKVCVPDISQCRKCQRRNRRMKLEIENDNSVHF